MLLTTRLATVVLALTLLLGVDAAAQAWRGLGRVAGKVTDEANQPMEGVLVKAYLPSAEGGTEVKTNKRGEWALGGIASGLWQIDFVKDGYQTRQISVSVTQTERLPRIDTVLDKTKPLEDPNVAIRQSLERAAALMEQGKSADARVIYEGILQQYPEAHQVLPLIARTYYAEGQYDRSIEYLRQAVAKNPGDIETKLLLGNVLVEKGDAEEGKRILASIDDTAITDPTTFVNIGIAMLNQKKPAEALTYFERAVTRFPSHPDAYYYRALTRLQLGETEAAKIDLRKFLEMAPDAPEAATAKKILEGLP